MEEQMKIRTGSCWFPYEVFKAVNHVPFTFKYDGHIWENLRRAGPDVVFTKDGKPSVYRWTHESGFRIEAKLKHYEDTGAIEWKITLHNDGNSNTKMIRDFWACKVLLPANGWKDTAILHRIHGGESTEEAWLPYDLELPPGSYEKWRPNFGRSSDGACPFFNLEYAAGTGVITAIGWTGQWRAEVWWGTKTELRCGIERLNFYLEPGESVTMPTITQLWYDGVTEQEAYNLWRRHMIKHVHAHNSDGLIEAPLAHLTTAAYEWNWSTADDVISHIDACKDLPYDVMWLDAYHMKPPGFPDACGDFSGPTINMFDRERFPNGMKPVSDRAHETGKEFLLWYSFEMVPRASWMAKEHPEWVLFAPEQKYGLFNIGIPEAREYITEYFVTAVESHGLDWLRFDCCPPVGEYFRHHNERDRIGITEIRWVEGLWKFLDDLREAHPKLKIDNCDGGGRRVDIEMCKRSVPLWRTDYTTPVMEHNDWDCAARLLQCSIAGMSRYIPINSCGQFSGKPYWFRSAVNGGVGILDDHRDEFYPIDEMNDSLEEAQRCKPFYLGDMYLHRGPWPTPTDWHVVQYHLPEKDMGIVKLFRREFASMSKCRLTLNGLEPGAIYRWCAESIEWTVGTFYAGDELEVTIDESPGSFLMIYWRIADPRESGA